MLYLRRHLNLQYNLTMLLKVRAKHISARMAHILFELRTPGYNRGNHPYQNCLICDAFASLCALGPIVAAIGEIKDRNEILPMKVRLHRNLIWLNSV